MHLDLFVWRISTIRMKRQDHWEVVNETNLSESHAFNKIGLIIDLLINANPKIVINGTLVFKHTLRRQAINKCINDGIGKSKDAAIIPVKNNDTLFCGMTQNTLVLNFYAFIHMKTCTLPQLVLPSLWPCSLHHNLLALLATGNPSQHHYLGPVLSSIPNNEEVLQDPPLHLI